MQAKAAQTKLWLSGNETFALGAAEAGVKVASGYLSNSNEGHGKK